MPSSIANAGFGPLVAPAAATAPAAAPLEAEAPVETEATLPARPLDAFGAAASGAAPSGPAPAEQAFLPSASPQSLWSTPSEAQADPQAGRTDQAKAILASLAQARAEKGSAGGSPSGAVAQGPQGAGALTAPGTPTLTPEQQNQLANKLAGADAAMDPQMLAAEGAEEFPVAPAQEAPARATTAPLSGPPTPTTASIIKAANEGPVSGEAPVEIRDREDPLCADLSSTEFELYTKLAMDDPEAADKFLLQQKLSKISELASLLSNIAKSRHDASMSIVSNMR